MRRVLACLPFFVFLRCIVIPVPGGSVVVTTQEQVRGRLGGLRAAIVATQLRLLRCPAPGGCYEGADVLKTLGDFRKAVRDAFPPDAAALRDPLEAYIDLQAESLGPPRPLDTIQNARYAASRPATGYAANAVRRVFDQIVKAIDRILSLDKLALPIYAQSEPPDADFVIQVGDDKLSRRSTTTNQKLDNVWRGVYTATIHRNGTPKDGTITLDLFNETHTGVVCKSNGTTWICHAQ